MVVSEHGLYLSIICNLLAQSVLQVIGYQLFWGFLINNTKYCDFKKKIIELL